MTIPQLKRSEVAKKIVAAEAALDDLGGRHRRLWDRVSIEPQKWLQSQYTDGDTCWVIGTLGQNCLYYNSAEDGWGWGTFDKWGEVSGFHCEQLEIHHVIAQTMFNIDNGSD